MSKMISFRYYFQKSFWPPFTTFRLGTEPVSIRHDGKSASSLGLVASGALLLSMFPLFYGCSDQNSQTSAPNSENGTSVGVYDAESTAVLNGDLSESTALETSQHSLALSEEDLAGLHSATESFSENFQDDKGQSSAKTEEKFTQEETLQVSDEIQERYSRLPDLTFAPTVVEHIGDEKAERYLLRYRFGPETEQRWNVSHRVWKKVLMAGHETEIETVSSIVRRWRIGQAEEIMSASEAAAPTPEENISEGTESSKKETAEVSSRYAVEYFIDEMNLEQHETGKDPVLYDSRTETPVPPEFAYFGTEKAVGTALERMKIDSFGMMTEKVKLVREFGGAPKDSRVMFPFPVEPVAVGETWTLPYTLFLTKRDKTIKTVNAIQKFTLENVTGEIATIRVRTVTTSIIGDPYLDGQLAERLFSGTCRFDIPRGKTLKTEIEFARTVPEAYGHATFLDYRCRVVEEWIRK